MLRDLIQTSVEINEKVYENIEVENLLDQVEQKIFNITQRSMSQKYVALKDELQPAYERIEKLHRGEEAVRGVSTGFAKIDDILSGLQRSDLIILGARPSLGKPLSLWTSPDTPPSKIRCQWEYFLWKCRGNK